MTDVSSIPSSPPARAANELDAAYHAQASEQAKRSGWKKWFCLFLALVAANLALWFHTNGSLSNDAGMPAIQAEIASDKIVSILDKSKPPSASSEKPVLPIAMTQSSPVDASACMLWTFASNGELKRADTLLTEQNWGGYLSELALEPAAYMVFTGPFEARSELNAKLKVIEKMNLKDYRTLPNNSISLGVFSTPEAAKAAAQVLTKRGLLGVNTSEKQNRVQRTRYRFEGLSPDSLKALNVLGSGLGNLTACS